MKKMGKKGAPERGFVVCLNNQDYYASLEVGKLYPVIKDEDAASHGYIRVIDESGEDYAYSQDRFFNVQLPKAVEDVLLSSVSGQSAT